MTKKLVVSASLLAKSQVASYTRSDGTVVQAHDNGRQAAAPKAPIAGASASGGSTKYGAEYPSLAKNMGKRHIHSDYDSGDSAESREYAEHVSSEVTGGSTKYTHEHAAAALQHAGRLLLERAQKAERGKNLHIAKTAHDLGHKLLAQADKHASAASGAQKAQAKPASKLAVRASVAKQATTKPSSAAPQKAADAAPGPMTPDAVKEHALQSGAKWKSNVAVFSRPESAHSFAETAATSKGSAFVMKHPNHAHHVVVSGADSQRMSKNGYEYVRPVMNGRGY